MNLMFIVLLFFICNSNVTSNDDGIDFCSQLTQQNLIIILGQAFNPRYMSIEQPTHNSNNAMGNKRSSHEIQFFADNDIVSVGDFPAWETNHLNYFEKKDETAEDTSSKIARNTFVERMSTKSDIFKSRPWECLSKINWIDLGVHYFPRYVRTIECTSKKCWYGHFNCKPKSFTIKVLRKKIGSCIRVSEKLVMMTADALLTEYTELWIWEEIAINFCCECVMVY